MGKPFIKLFKTPNSGYFLDVNKNEFVQIDSSSYQYLHNVLFHEDATAQPMPSELAELKKEGFLSEKSVVEEVQHPNTQYLDVFLERKLSKMTLQLTQNCNFRCTYCVYSGDDNSRQRVHSSKRMTWETAKKAIDFLLEHSVDSKHVNVGFYGGEPLLEFALIKQIVAYCKGLFSGKELSFSITTNGTLLNDEMIHFFQNHDVPIMISLDGPKEINDKNRVFADGNGTFDSVIERINRIKEIAPDYAKKLQVSMVINPENDFDCINTICLDGADLDALDISPSMVDLIFDDKTPTYSEDYIWKLEYQKFLAVLSQYNRFPKESVSPIANKGVLRSFQDHSQIDAAPALKAVDAPAGPCIPGQLRLLVNVLEELIPCERVSEKSAAMIIGTLSDGFYLEKASQILNVGKLTKDACRNCWCFRFCSMCAKKADDGSSNLSAKVKLSFCEGVRADTYNRNRYYILAKEIPMYYKQQARPIVLKEGENK